MRRSNKPFARPFQVKGVMPAAAPETQEAVVAATASCMNLYLAAVLSRVSDAVTLAFPGGNRALPTAAELHKCIGCAPRPGHQGLLGL